MAATSVTIQLCSSLDADLGREALGTKSQECRATLGPFQASESGGGEETSASFIVTPKRSWSQAINVNSLYAADSAVGARKRKKTEGAESLCGRAHGTFADGQTGHETDELCAHASSGDGGRRRRAGQTKDGFCLIGFRYVFDEDSQTFRFSVGGGFGGRISCYQRGGARAPGGQGAD